MIPLKIYFKQEGLENLNVYFWVSMSHICFLFFYARVLIYVLNHHILVKRPVETGSILTIALNWESGDYCF